MKCDTAAHAAGYQPVSVRCGNGEKFEVPSQFHFHDDVTPKICGISPSEGLTLGESVLYQFA